MDQSYYIGATFYRYCIITDYNTKIIPIMLILPCIQLTLY